MLKLIEFLDLRLAFWIGDKIKNPTLDTFLSYLNRGEVFVLLVIFLLYDAPEPFLRSIFFLSLLAFINDRFVLFLKKKISRKRPGLRVLGKEDNHPDLCHSFPSAHAANSMLGVLILVYLFHQNPILFLLPVLAGVGRMFSLHHFLSDVLGGWFIGLCFGILGIAFYDTILLKFWA